MVMCANSGVYPCHGWQRSKGFTPHNITYMSGLFKRSQINWACLTKEAYDIYIYIYIYIYMSVKKLEYYLEDADITLRSDHLPLQKFLAQNTLNLKVNRWAIEIVSYCFHFQYIKGIKNTLADTMSQLVKIDPETIRNRTIQV